MPSPNYWNKVQDLFGGPSGHNLDLMPLDSNVQRDRFGEQFPHFTPYPTPGSVGVDVFSQNLQHCDGKEVNAYVFPPFGLIHPLLGYLQSQRATVTMVVPVKSPRVLLGGQLLYPSLRQAFSLPEMVPWMFCLPLPSVDLN